MEREVELPTKCPDCGKELITKQGKIEIEGNEYPIWKFLVCPDCGPILGKKDKRGE